MRVAGYGKWSLPMLKLCLKKSLGLLAVLALAAGPALSPRLCPG